MRDRIRVCKLSSLPESVASKTRVCHEWTRGTAVVVPVKSGGPFFS